MNGYMNREAYSPDNVDVKTIVCPSQKVVWRNTAAEPSAKIILFMPPGKELKKEYQLPMNGRKKQ